MYVCFVFGCMRRIRFALVEKSRGNCLPFQSKYSRCFSPCSSRNRAFFNPVFCKYPSPRTVPTRISCCRFVIFTIIFEVSRLPTVFHKDENPIHILYQERPPWVHRYKPYLFLLNCSKRGQHNSFFRVYPQSSFYPLIFGRV